MYKYNLIKKFETLIFKNLLNYHLDNVEIQRIFDIYVNNDIYFFDGSDSNDNYISVYDSNGNFIKNKFISPRSCTLDYIPICLNDIILLRPSICIFSCSNSSLEILIKDIIHEICHLYTIGKYIFDGDYCYHTFGINKYIYKINNQKLYLVNSENFNTLNELINEYITFYFCENIIQLDSRKYNLLKLFSKFIKENNVDNDLLIKYYFSNDTDSLKKILLNDNFHSFSDLEMYYNLNSKK